MADMKLITTLLVAILFVGLTWMLCAAPVHADTHYVMQGGTGTGSFPLYVVGADGGQWTNAAGSMQTAIDNASTGDEIWVAAGTYSGSITVPPGIKIFGGFSGLGLSRDDRNWKSNVTTITGGTITVTGSSSAMSAIDGFTVTGCSSISLTGNVVFSHNIATGNTIPNDVNPLIKCSGPVILVNNLIYGNTSRHPDEFVGIRCLSNQGEPNVVNNTIAGNLRSPVEISCSGCTASATLSNNIVCSGLGIMDGNANANPVLSYNCVASCPLGSYVSFPLGWTPPATEISAVPQFVGSPDFRLQPTSPCIDVQGANDAINSSSIPDFAKSKDLDGYTRIYNTNVDIGAYEHYPTEYFTFTFDPPPGEYSCSYRWVKITCSTQHDSIIYTIDNTDPALGSSSTRVYEPTGYVCVHVNGTPLKVIALQNNVPVASGQATYSFYSPSSGSAYTRWKWRYLTQAPDSLGVLHIENVFPCTSSPGDQNHCTIRTAWGLPAWVSSTGWDYNTFYNTYQVKRKVGDIETISDPITNTYFDDAGVDFGSTYQYAVRGCDYVESLPSYLSEGQQDPNCGDDDPSCFYRDRYIGNSAWSPYVTVTTAQVPVTENQTVDSRIDLRKDDDVPVNFDFQDRTYRGGLFVGAMCLPDESRVGRSFLKFEVPTLPTNANMWMGSLNAYYTGSANEAPITVGCQYLNNDSWVDHGAGCITWAETQTLFPNFSPANGIDTMTVSGQDGKWCHWDSVLNDLLWKVTPEDRFLTYGLALNQEPDPMSAVPNNSHGWAYFAKKEYAPAIGPCITYAYSNDAPVRVVDLTLSQSSVQGGNTVTGTLWLNAPAPSGGYRAYVRSHSVNKVCGPWSGVLIPAGEHSCSFTISTAIVASSTVEDIYVYSSGYVISRELTITQ